MAVVNGNVVFFGRLWRLFWGFDLTGGWPDSGLSYCLSQYRPLAMGGVWGGVSCSGAILEYSWGHCSHRDSIRSKFECCFSQDSTCFTFLRCSSYVMYLEALVDILDWLAMRSLLWCARLAEKFILLVLVYQNGVKIRKDCAWKFAKPRPCKRSIWLT